MTAGRRSAGPPATACEQLVVLADGALLAAADQRAAALEFPRANI